MQTFVYSDQLRQYNEIAERLRLPITLRFQNLEDSDTERVLEFFNPRFLRVDQMQPRIHDEGGLWHPLRTSSLRTQALVRRLIEDGRKEAAKLFPNFCIDLSQNDIAFWEEWISFRNPCTSAHVSRVTSQLAQVLMIQDSFSLVHVESSERFDNRNRRPLIPLSEANFGAIDLTQNPFGLLPPSLVADQRLTFQGWALPTPDPAIKNSEAAGVQAMRKALEERYSDALITRLARHLCGVGKHIDVIVAPADWGKSTLISICAKAFPGMVGRLELSKALSSQGTKFSQIEGELTSKLIVFVDEGGEEPAATIRPGALKMFVDDDLQVERKGQDSRTLRRLGSVIICGHDWPHIDTGAQGMAERFKWAFRAGHGNPMPQAERDLLMSDDAISYFRLAVIERACQLWQGGNLDDQCQSIDIETARKDFMDSRFNPVALMLTQEIVVSEGQWVESALISSLIENFNGGKRPEPNVIKAAMNAAFPADKVRSKVKKVGGKSTRVWVNVALNPEESELL